MAITKGKKRYQITLTQETVEEFQALAEEMNMPRGTMSNILDESLLKTLKAIKKFRARKSATFADLFAVIGEELDELNEEVKQDDAKEVHAGKKTKGA